MEIFIQQYCCLIQIIVINVATAAAACIPCAAVSVVRPIFGSGDNFHGICRHYLDYRYVEKERGL